jgi:hypothetical protein
LLLSKPEPHRLSDLSHYVLSHLVLSKSGEITKNFSLVPRTRSTPEFPRPDPDVSSRMYSVGLRKKPTPSWYPQTPRWRRAECDVTVSDVITSRCYLLLFGVFITGIPEIIPDSSRIIISSSSHLTITPSVHHCQ